MFIYRQKPPRLVHQINNDNKLMQPSVLYSGFQEGLNNPDVEDRHAIGPIPKGKWMILRWTDKHPTKGPVVAILVPVSHLAHNRTGFLIHGDNATPTPFDGSHGCIVTDRATREYMRDSDDYELLVE